MEEEIRAKGGEEDQNPLAQKRFGPNALVLLSYRLRGGRLPKALSPVGE